MPRTMTLAALQSSMKQEVDETFLEIIEIDHTALPSPLRYVNDTEAVTSGGNLYTPFPFQVGLPPDAEDQIASLTLTIVAIDTSIVQALRSIDTKPEVTLEIIKKSAPDTIEAGPYILAVTGFEYVGDFLQLDLGFHRNLFNDPYPKDIFAPWNSP